MATQSYTDLVANTVAASTTITGSVTETIVASSIGTQGFSIPANYMFQGKAFRITASGVYTSAASSQGTLTFKIHMGTAGTNADLVICGSPAITVPASGSNTGWDLEAWVTCWAVGSSGNTVIGLGRAVVATVTTGADIVYHLHGAAGATAPAAVAVNTQVANFLGAYATFSSATTNTLQCFHFSLEELN